MRLTITIECDNAAFDDDPAHEVLRILHQQAYRIGAKGLAYGDAWPVQDVNGNTVGQAKITKGRR